MPGAFLYQHSGNGQNCPMVTERTKLEEILWAKLEEILSANDELVHVEAFTSRRLDLCEKARDLWSRRMDETRALLGANRAQVRTADE
jgi:hypothetical protein